MEGRNTVLETSFKEKIQWCLKLQLLACAVQLHEPINSFLLEPVLVGVCVTCNANTQPLSNVAAVLGWVLPEASGKTKV